MGAEVRRLLTTSVFKKQVVAVTGLVLVLFVIGHLAGNLLLIAGPAAFNGYAAKLQKLGALLWVVRLGLIAAAVLHIVATVLVTLENWRARGGRYAAFEPVGDRSFAAKTMIYSGLLIFVFLFLHLSDFTFADKEGPNSVIAGVNGGESLHLFGLVWNSFLNPLRSGAYIFAMVCVGLHLSHAIQSAFQTFGLNHDRYTPLIRRVSFLAGLIVAAGFITIPLYVIVSTYALGGPSV